MPTAADLRELLLSPDEAIEMDAPGRIDAAVLVPLLVDGAEPVAVFTERRADLRRHGGEISFPGGRRDTPEEDLRRTALREAEEEVGLAAAEVELVGALPPVGTLVTGYRVYPFVGLVAGARAWTPQEAEVARVLELSLGDLVRGHAQQRLVRRGVPFKTPTYTVDGNLVWGATARIVGELLARLAPLL